MPPGVIKIGRHELFRTSKDIKSNFNLNSDLSCSKGQANSKKTNSSDWFKLPEKECTEESLYEFKALHLRTSADPKSFYKPDNSMKSPPVAFTFGRVVDTGRLKTGAGQESSTYKSEKNKTGLSFVQELLRDSNTQKWANKKYAEIQRMKAKGGKKWYARQVAKRKKY
ncbi:hypothetical protein FG386_001945 [Cryptosporidium ryanae]|uniref:uncharacterized protein n=1 Tax=Cryptosporidium ryanae TaxID=515981 RepID=UPI00351A0057|nr:hypothetical protein FG386_001945 [Cryptosporidium ryanae]